MKHHDYLKKFRQSKIECWTWRMLALLSAINMVFALLAHRWYPAGNAAVISLFALRICSLEKYISDCNCESDKKDD